MEVDKTFICAWCAKELGRGEQSVLHPDIESASQVGSHVSFPQWESGGMCVIVAFIFEAIVR